MICAFTGHRPEKLPWGMDESDPRCVALKQKLLQTVLEQAAEGADVFLCGMARGCDLYFAQAVLDAKQSCPELTLEAWLPCPSQAERWTQREKSCYRRLLEQCDRVLVLESAYSDGCMLRRNRAMVERCDRLISVWDGSGGGTAATIRYAQKSGRTLIGLWL